MNQTHKVMENKTIINVGFGSSDLGVRSSEFNVRSFAFQLSNFSFLTLAILLSLLISNPIQAQSLDDYLILAAENNPGLKASYARYQAMAERVNQPSLADPELQVGFFIEPMERFMGNQTADFRLMQMFPWFGMIGTQKEEAYHMAKAQYQLFLEEKNQLLFQVKSTWYELIRLKEEIKISEENLGYLKKYEELALSRFKVGTSSSSPIPSLSQASISSTSAGNSSGMDRMTSKASNSMEKPSPMNSGMNAVPMGNATAGMSAVLQIRLQLRELENSIEQSKSNLEPLQVKFNQLLNREIRSEINLPAQLEKPALSLQKQEILDSIRMYNPMLAMYQSEIGAYEQQAKMARLEGKPMMGAGINYMTFVPRLENNMPMGGENMVMPMVSLSLPIYRKKIDSKIKQAEYLKEAALLDKQKTENLLAIDWANAFLTWEESERNLRLFEDQIQLVNQQIQLLETSFISNETGLEEVLRANQQLLDYKQKRINALNQQQQSLAQLEALAATSLTFPQ
jgi:outer membrane protein TolC